MQYTVEDYLILLFESTTTLKRRLKSHFNIRYPFVTDCCWCLEALCFRVTRPSVRV